ncbi:hypothetical protein HYZ80_02270 [Candidatus Parcubacteria bacterium]|nr:hypothetical protein [Candidatus Parcubacteria bacterium]
MRRALFAIALLAILFVAAPPPAIATDTMNPGSEPILTVNITASGDIDITVWITVPQYMATWTSFQRDGLTTMTAAIPVTVTAPATATLRGLTADISSSPHWRLAECTGTGTAHGDIDTTTKPAPALIASTDGGLLGQPLRR